MSDTYSSFKFVRGVLKMNIEFLEDPKLDKKAYRKEVVDSLKVLGEWEAQLAQEEPTRLPDAEAEELKKRAEKLLRL